MSEEESMTDDNEKRLNFICAKCMQPLSEHFGSFDGCNTRDGDTTFQPSGNVSVPASFIDKVRALVDKIEYGIVTKDEMETAHAVREALAEIKKGE